MELMVHECRPDAERCLSREADERDIALVVEWLREQGATNYGTASNVLRRHVRETKSDPCIVCDEKPRRPLPNPIPEGTPVMFTESVAGQALYCQACFDVSGFPEQGDDDE